MKNIRIPALTLLGLFVLMIIIFGDEMNESNSFGSIIFSVGFSAIVLNIFIFSSLPYRRSKQVRFQYRISQIFAFIGIFVFPSLVYYLFGTKNEGLEVFEVIIFMSIMFLSLIGAAAPWIYCFSKKVYEVNRSRKQ